MGAKEQSNARYGTRVMPTPPATFNFRWDARVEQAGSKFQSQRVATGGERADAKALIANLRENADLVAKLGQVVNTTEEEQAQHANATDTVNAEYQGGALLPDEVQVMRAELSGDPAELELFDAAVLDVIREQHAAPGGSGLESLPPALAFQVGSAAATAADRGSQELVPGDAVTDAADPKAGAQQGFKVTFLTRTQVESSYQGSSEWRARQGIAGNAIRASMNQIQAQADSTAITKFGMPQACADPVFNYELTNAAGQPLDTSYMELAEEQRFADELSPVVSRVYDERLAAQVASLHPQTPADWEAARRTAWRETMSSSEVSSIVDRLISAGAEPQLGRTALDDVAEAARDGGARLLFDRVGGQNFALYPLPPSPFGIDVAALTPEQLQPFIDELSNGGLLANTYKKYLSEALDALASSGTPPTTQAEFDSVQNTAWEKTLDDPAVTDVLLRLQVAIKEARAAESLAKDVWQISGPVMRGVFHGAWTLDKIFAEGADPKAVLEQALPAEQLEPYRQCRKQRELSLGEAGAAAFDARLLQDLQQQCRLIEQVKPLLPDLTSLADTPNRPGHVVREDEQPGWGDGKALEVSMEGKDASALWAARERAVREHGPEAGDVFDSLALAELRKLSENSAQNHVFGREDLFAGGGPLSQDIRQDGFGDCYALAAFMALADRQPQVIRDAIQYDETTHNYTVKLYDEAGKPFTVEVTQEELKRNLFGQEEYDARRADGSVVSITGGGSAVDNNKGANGATWPAVLEVALAKARDDDPSDGLKQGYTVLANGGWAGEITRQLTGRSTYPSVPAPENAEFLLRRASLGDSMTFGTVTLPQALKDKGMLERHAYQIDSIRRDKSGEVILTLRDPGGDIYIGGDVQRQTLIELKLSELSGAEGLYIDMLGKLPVDSEISLYEFVSATPAGRLSTHRANGATAGNGEGAKSISMSIKQYTDNGLTDYTGVVDDVYTTPGSPPGNLLPAEYQIKRAELRARIDAGDAAAKDELNYLDSEIIARAKAEEAEFPPHAYLGLQTYIDSKRAEIDALDLSLIPPEFVQAARDFAQNNPNALQFEVLSHVYLDDTGNTRVTGDEAADTQLQSLAAMNSISIWDGGMQGFTKIGVDGSHPQGDSQAGLVASAAVAHLLLVKLAY